MNGLTENTKKQFEKISNLSCIRDYTLIGGTALSLQINHRLSENLNFFSWPKEKKAFVDQVSIDKELKEKFNDFKKEILDFNQVNYLVQGVKLSFHINENQSSKIIDNKPFHNNIKLANIERIGALKLKVMLQRSNFRDYYDIYSILMEGINIKTIVDKSLKYSSHNISTKNILNFISNNNNFAKENNFDLLRPKYSVDEKMIEKLLKQKIQKDYTIIKNK